jgi:sulfide:quinone oxidoreductase
MADITILGAGFGALRTIREVRRRKIGARITVIAPDDTFTYFPSLIWMPSGLRRNADLTVPLADFFARHQVTFRKGAVRRVSEDGRAVVTDDGEIANDALVIASGGRFLRKLPGIDNAIIPCGGVASGQAIHDRLAAMEGGTIALGFATNPAEPGAMRGGPVFEFLFGIDTLLRRQGRRDRFRLVFFNPAAQPGARLGAKAVSGLLTEMSRRGIDTHLGHKPVRFDPDRVITEGGEIPADLILFMPGMTGPAWLEDSALPRSPGGFIAADALCRVVGLRRTYVVGDAGSFPGPDWMAKQAHQAELHARAAVANLADELSGREPATPFKSELICIVDTLDTGILVYRGERRNVVLPGMRPMHWAKRAFEHLYLRGIA